MFRLLALTVAGLGGALAYWGEPVAGAASTAPMAAHAATKAAPRATAAVANNVSGAELIAAAMSVPAAHEAAPPFAGPKLQPSPEYAASGAAATQDAAPAGALYVAADSVNLRAGPGQEHARVGRLLRGAPVVAVGSTTGAWVEVRDMAGLQGYVSAKFLSANQPG